MNKAPAGSLVKIYYDSLVSVNEGDYIQTPTDRTYLIVGVRLQKRGMHRHRKHIQAIVMPAEFQIPKDGIVHPLYWYPRGK